MLGYKLNPYEAPKTNTVASTGEGEVEEVTILPEYGRVWVHQWKMLIAAVIGGFIICVIANGLRGDGGRLWLMLIASAAVAVWVISALISSVRFDKYFQSIQRKNYIRIGNKKLTIKSLSVSKDLPLINVGRLSLSYPILYIKTKNVLFDEKIRVGIFHKDDLQKIVSVING